MTAPRVFSDEELRIGGLRSIDALDEALARGDREAARRFVTRLRPEDTPERYFTRLGLEKPRSE